MKKLNFLLVILLISFSNIALSELKALECTIPGDPWKAVRTLTFDLSKEEAEWKTKKTYYKGRAGRMGKTDITTFLATLSVFPNNLRFTIDKRNYMDVSRKDLSFVHTWYWQDLRQTNQGFCKLVEIEEDPDNIL